MANNMIPIHKESSGLSQTALVELWELDLRKLGGEIYRFCNIGNTMGKSIVWQGNTYEGYPVKADGFEYSSDSSPARPKLTVANVMGLVTAAAEEYNQLIGAQIRRRQTFARFLDAANFPNGNPDADPSQEFVSLFLVERLVSLNATSATLELAAPAETDGSAIPSRFMLANTCCWQYRSAECGYSGKPVADKYDMPTDSWEKDDCSKTLLGCRAHFGATAVLPIGSWPSADKVNT